MISDNEKFLISWLRISSTVCNERIVSDTMPFNEALVCDVLYYHDLLGVKEWLTAADLCRMTHMHKTLMNRTLKSLEKKQMIQRKQNPMDKRKHFLMIDRTNFGSFLEVHDNTMNFVEKVAVHLGKEKMKQATEIFHDVSEAVDSLMYKKMEEKRDD